MTPNKQQTKQARDEIYPGCLIERSAIEQNRTPIVRLYSVIEHNRTQKNFVNRTHSNVWLSNGRQSNTNVWLSNGWQSMRWSPNRIWFDCEGFCSISSICLIIELAQCSIMFDCVTQSNNNRLIGVWLFFCLIRHPGNLQIHLYLVLKVWGIKPLFLQGLFCEVKLCSAVLLSKEAE